MKLYGYWRSSAAYRVRIALHLKNVAFDNVPVHLVKDGGEQHQDEYVKLNPTHLVPTLVDQVTLPDGSSEELVLNQSIAILDYIEQKHPGNAIYPDNVIDKAKVQAMALDIACEVHPLNNLRVQQYLAKSLSVNDEDKLAWSHHWMAQGFAALEKTLAKCAGKFCYADTVSLADICLVPQVYNARRFNLDMSPYPIICKIVDNCNALDAFQKALPENQPDAT